eukprot:c12423_g1_i1 orf=59-1534(+)
MKEQEEEEEGSAGRSGWRARVCIGAGWGAALFLRIVCVLLGAPSLLGRRVEISTPVNSFTRLAEGYWLKQIGSSPYAGSAYHGSPLLLAMFGPLTTSGAGGQPALKLSLSLLCITADFAAALLLVQIGRHLQSARSKQFSLLHLTKLIMNADGVKLEVGEFAAMFYLWNPFTLVSCVGGCTTSIENAMIILSLYGAVAGNVPLAAFGWVIATHCSLYPAILLIPIGLSLTVGIDHPPAKLFKRARLREAPTEKLESSSLPADKEEETQWLDEGLPKDSSYRFKATKLRDLIVWSVLWWAHVLVLCKISVGKSEGLKKMFSETYGFILNVEELSPNLGVFWYFFTEVFDFFRPFFLLVFHANILFMILPLTIRLHHRPLFLAFVFCSIFTMLKSYPSVGDAALYLGLMPLFINELSGMRFTFFLLNGYIGVALLSPVMYNLWIWRGTGNANFYFAMALSNACIQLILIAESVSTILVFDRNLRKLKDTDKLS